MRALIALAAIVLSSSCVARKQDAEPSDRQGAGPQGILLQIKKKAKDQGVIKSTTGSCSYVIKADEFGSGDLDLYISWESMDNEPAYQFKGDLKKGFRNILYYSSRGGLLDGIRPGTPPAPEHVELHYSSDFVITKLQRKSGGNVAECDFAKAAMESSSTGTGDQIFRSILQKAQVDRVVRTPEGNRQGNCAYTVKTDEFGSGVRDLYVSWENRDAEPSYHFKGTFRKRDSGNSLVASSGGSVLDPIRPGTGGGPETIELVYGDDLVITELKQFSGDRVINTCVFRTSDD